MRNGLIEAYKGYYEKELERDQRATYDEYVKDEGCNGEFAVETFESWVEGHVRAMIENDTPKRRLEIYCEWNGILSYSDTLYAIATGEL
jgi:hypothetical protein